MDKSGRQQTDKERPLSRNTMFTRRQKEIMAEMSAIKSEDSRSKFLQTLQKQKAVCFPALQHDNDAG
jgi:hypothetical protein